MSTNVAHLAKALVPNPRGRGIESGVGNVDPMEVPFWPFCFVPLVALATALQGLAPVSLLAAILLYMFLK